MPTSVGIKPKLGEDPSGHNSTSAIEDDDSEDDTVTINDVASLKCGIIKTAKNQARVSYTILLLGEIGVGKSSTVELIANVLAGNDTDHYNFNILDQSNELGGSNSQSQTNLARIYEFISSNGILVRIVDTPGLADAHRPQQDEPHKRDVATQIKNHIDSVTAVLVLVDGTFPRITVSSNYALSILSAIFTKSLASNIAFVFTNVLNPLHWNFSKDTIPDVLKDVPHFLINNPVALQKKYLKLKDDPYMKTGGAEFRKAVKSSEENALETLVELFDWLNRLEPQPTTNIVPFFQEAENIMSILADTHPLTDQEAVAGKAEDSTPASISNLKLSHKSTEEKEVVNRLLGKVRGGWGPKKLKLRRLAGEKVPRKTGISTDSGGPPKDETSFVGLLRGTPDDDDRDIAPTINDVESLKKGIIKTSENLVRVPYTILLVGETGVGKSAFLEFIANVLIGNTIDRYDFQILDHSNEQNGSTNQSQTKSSRFHKLTSKNGMVVRILDTPGFVDTRDIRKDELHNKNIATEIQKHIDIDSITAVLVLTNGTVPGLPIGTEHALSTLSAIFPNCLSNNIAFLLTNVSSPTFRNFAMNTIPEPLKDADMFFLDNPIALQKKYLSFKDDLDKQKVRAEMRRAVLAGEEQALEMLVDLFDWLDRLGPQPTTEIVYLYKLSQSIEAMITDTLAQMDQAAAKKVEIDKLMIALKNNSYDMNVIINLENTITMPVWKLRHSFTNNMICGQAKCYSNCDIDYKSNIRLDLEGRFKDKCSKCDHSLWDHHRCHSTWGQVIDTQVLIDQGVKRKWAAAKDGKGKMAVLDAICKRVQRHLNQIINGATNDLARHVKRYTRLSLSGNFSAQVSNVVRLLEQNYTTLETKGVDLDQLQKVKESVEHMKRKLELLIGVKENAWKDRVGIAGSQRGEDEASEERASERVSLGYIDTQWVGVAGSQGGEDEVNEKRMGERASQVYIDKQRVSVEGSQREDERASIVGLYRSITLESYYSGGK